ncbi:DUF2129 domain-containing protein [Aquibacillus sp. 3ASR75-11]|uniref:UPF0298 protein NC797_04220 n=1 Tax=Terrihalobacillus insolitus TaxID=2950438 RepID=A0A9X4AMP7_9BACI|nr:DUF2129 domain-containing protein [Terrihalobacillus insolitus]MDC3412810.1 DUF2129 domain-containing protein [Terrihalobacillus insolitus]MDC3423713.1 DUF2129 domain-containing protein [Terrihalobacillus insolitus]
MRTKRQGLIVWFQHMKNVKHLKRFGHLIYVSKSEKYAVLYVNQEDLGEIENKLNRLPFVSKTAPSFKPFIPTEYDNAKPDKAKEYDYKMGI